MIKKLSLSGKLLIACLLSFLVFFPSLSTFYTHDDFFLLKISRAKSLGEFINFFNFTQGPDGLGVYRPLTTQVFYFLGNSIFKLNPVFLHVISFLTFFVIIYLIYKLIHILTKNDSISFVATILYAASATHYGHFYYLATYQELGLTVFVLLTSIFFIEYVRKSKKKYLCLSLTSYLLALLSKETAIVVPGLLVAIYAYLYFKKEKVVSIKKFLQILASFIGILLVYLYFHFFVYGLAQGESYIWDFSPRFINTLFWYGLWSLNLPEMLVDFVGSGLKFNPNLFRFWSAEVMPIFILFGASLILIVYFVIRAWKKLKKNDYLLLAFVLSWFVLTLIPVLFLPLHKFTFYLTLPLIGVVMGISHFINKAKVAGIYKLIFIFVWTLLSVYSLRLTTKTHWISQGSQVARNAYVFFSQYEKEGVDVKYVDFYDTEEDIELPWSPSELVKVVISQNNFFEVFFPGQFRLLDSGEETKAEIIRIHARSLLNY